MSNRIGDNLVHFEANAELVRALTGSGVRFVVVGGLAVAWHCAERTADDMDLLVEPTPENSGRISRVLTRLGLSGHSSTSFAKLGLQVPLKSTYYAELLTPKEGTVSFDTANAAAVEAKLFNIPIRIASVSTLIAMKQQAATSADAQRDKHLKDIALLQALTR
jgi:hypothetical protein